MPCLTDLPPELLCDIARLLTPARPDVKPYKEGSYTSVRQDSYTSDHWDSLAALACLARTCKTWQHIAQRQLFRCPEARYSKPIALVRTLVEWPDLASAIKELHVGQCWMLYGTDYPPDCSTDWEISREDAALFNEHLAVHCQTELSPMVGINDDWLDEEQDAIGALAALAIAQATNIERLVLQTLQWDLPESFRPPTLPRLTEFVFEHGDVELAIQVDHVLGIFAAAPALKRFHGHMVDFVSEDLFHGGVTEVTLSCSSLEYDSFKALIKGFPNLQKFGYEAGLLLSYISPVSPREIPDMLGLRSDTIQHLSLCAQDLHFPWSDDELMLSLAHMDVLESLEVDTCWLSNDPALGAPLIRLLPPSIRCLTIRNYFHREVTNLELLAEAAPVQFPTLKEVRFAGKVGEGAEEAFNANGISFYSECSV